jgi:hypothetical protein
MTFMPPQGSRITLTGGFGPAAAALHAYGQDHVIAQPWVSAT